MIILRQTVRGLKYPMMSVVKDLWGQVLFSNLRETAKKPALENGTVYFLVISIPELVLLFPALQAGKVSGIS